MKVAFVSTQQIKNGKFGACVKTLGLTFDDRTADEVARERLASHLTSTFDPHSESTKKTREKLHITNGFD